jgi:dihydroorotase
MRLRIHSGRLNDPSSGHDAIGELWIEDGLILSLGRAPRGLKADDTFDASGLVLAKAG